MVIHQPRVAWDGARAFVLAAGRPSYFSFADRLGVFLGPELRHELHETRVRLLTASARTGGDRGQTDLEAGRWRVRLEELLSSRPDLTSAVQDLTTLARKL